MLETKVATFESSLTTGEKPRKERCTFQTVSATPARHGFQCALSETIDQWAENITMCVGLIVREGTHCLLPIHHRWIMNKLWGRGVLLMSLRGQKCKTTLFNKFGFIPYK